MSSEMVGSACPPKVEMTTIHSSILVTAKIIDHRNNRILGPAGTLAARSSISLFARRLSRIRAIRYIAVQQGLRRLPGRLCFAERRRFVHSPPFPVSDRIRCACAKYVKFVGSACLNLRSRYRTGMPRAAPYEFEAVLFVLDKVWRSTQHEHLSRMSWLTGSIAGPQPCRRVDGRESRAWPELPRSMQNRSGLVKTIFIPISKGVSDFPVRSPARSKWRH